MSQSIQSNSTKLFYYLNLDNNILKLLRLFQKQTKYKQKQDYEVFLQELRKIGDLANLALSSYNCISQRARSPIGQLGLHVPPLVVEDSLSGVLPLSEREADFFYDFTDTVFWPLLLQLASPAPQRLVWPCKCSSVQNTSKTVKKAQEPE